MGIFKKKKTSERNEIQNNELKEKLATTALGLLQEGKDYITLANTICEFGYLFIIENHGLEALFKMSTDVNTYYFTAQGNSLKLLNLNEELFQDTTEKFFEFASMKKKE